VIAVVVFAALVGPGDRGTLQAAVRFEARLAETQPIPGLIVARIGNSDRVIYLRPEAIVTNEDIAQSWVTQDGPNRYGVSVQLLPDGAQRMRQATAAHIGRPMAILVDGEVVTAPTVRSAVGDSAWINGDYSQAEAQRIADGIGVR
jgi:preprotein translocase subunit SecD